jgi:hypothetical protein
VHVSRSPKQQERHTLDDANSRHGSLSTALAVAWGRVQLAAGFLVEVGNDEQDKFIFDLGTGAYINLWATGVPMAKLTKGGVGVLPLAMGCMLPASKKRGSPATVLEAVPHCSILVCGAAH